METLIYIGKINLAIAVFALAYRLLLHRDYYLKARRVFLLLALISSLIVNYLPSPFSEIIVPVEQPTFSNVQVVSADGEPTNFLLIVSLVLWAVGVLFMAFKLISALHTIVKLRNIATHKSAFGIDYLEVEKNTAPFTIFNWIFVDKSTAVTEEILRHERAHQSSMHYIDTLFIEVVNIVFWFNPALWYIRKAAIENLECMADRAVIAKGIDSKSYQYSLVGMHYTTTRNTVASYFNTSQIKNRIVMINKVKQQPLTLLKYVALPAIIVAMSCAAPRDVKYTPLTENIATSTIEADPLFIVDGIEKTKEEVSAIPVDNIKEITVLKDESATKLYGEKAKNGVVLMTSF